MAGRIEPFGASRGARQREWGHGEPGIGASMKDLIERCTSILAQRGIGLTIIKHLLNYRSMMALLVAFQEAQRSLSETTGAEHVQQRKQ